MGPSPSAVSAKFEKEEKDKKYHRIERSYGSFVRSFALPEGTNASKVAAEFKRRRADGAFAEERRGQTEVGGSQNQLKIPRGVAADSDRPLQPRIVHVMCWIVGTHFLSLLSVCSPPAPVPNAARRACR